MSETRLLPIAVLLFFSTGFLPGCDWIRPWMGAQTCVLSGREIHSGMAAEIEVPGEGIHGRTCCLRCAVTHAHQTGNDVQVLSVTDHASGRPIDAEEAVYVVGSRVAPCAAPVLEFEVGRREVVEEIWDRCRSSTIAFADSEEAQKFVRENGGEVQTFAKIAGSLRDPERPGWLHGKGGETGERLPPRRSRAHGERARRGSR